MTPIILLIRWSLAKLTIMLSLIWPHPVHGPMGLCTVALHILDAWKRVAHKDAFLMPITFQLVFMFIVLHHDFFWTKIKVRDIAKQLHPASWRTGRAKSIKLVVSLIHHLLHTIYKLSWEIELVKRILLNVFFCFEYFNLL